MDVRVLATPSFPHHSILYPLPPSPPPFSLTSPLPHSPPFLSPSSPSVAPLPLLPSPLPIPCSCRVRAIPSSRAPLLSERSSHAHKLPRIASIHMIPYRPISLPSPQPSPPQDDAHRDLKRTASQRSKYASCNDALLLPLSSSFHRNGDRASTTVFYAYASQAPSKDSLTILSLDDRLFVCAPV